MSMKLMTALAACALCAFAVPASAGSVSEMLALPSFETKQAVDALTPQKPPASFQFKDLQFKGLKIDKKKIGPLFKDAINEVDEKGRGTVPFAAQDLMILQFQPQTTQAQIEDYLKIEQNGGR